MHESFLLFLSNRLVHVKNEESQGAQQGESTSNFPQCAPSVLYVCIDDFEVIVVRAYWLRILFDVNALTSVFLRAASLAVAVAASCFLRPASFVPMFFCFGNDNALIVR